MMAIRAFSLVLAVVGGALARSHNGTHHFTNTIHHVEEQAYPLHRAGHNRSTSRGCGEWCRQAAKHMRMKANMEEKVRQHNECVEKSECPLNRKFLPKTECNNGKAAGFECNNVDLLSFVPIQELGSTYDASDSWGWTDPETGDEIAIIGMMDGTSFVQGTVRAPVK